MRSAPHPEVKWQKPAIRTFETIESIVVAMEDGVRISVRMWIPAGAERIPVGAVLECTPYRARDLTRVEDDVVGAHLASHGFIYARADVRGTGNSTGLIDDEYSLAQQQDLLALIDWVSKTEWCNGSVGIRGYSWGANVALQAAIHDPPALKAIVAGCPSVHRYSTDAHWIGGLWGFVNLHWGTFFKSCAAYPPDPLVFGPLWREEWIHRLSHLPDIVTRWTENANDTDYWACGSVMEKIGQIKCAVYAFSGVRDGYVNVVPWLMETLKCPTKGLIGPWAHSFPHRGIPGPAMDWLEEEVRWWAQWLSGDATGIMEEPKVHIYVADGTPLPEHFEEVGGHWWHCNEWHTKQIESRTFFLDRGGLSDTPRGHGSIKLCSDNVVGLRWREWIPFHMPDDLPPVQNDDDAISTCFDTMPLQHDLVIIGRPRVTLQYAKAPGDSILAIRLTEVTPDGFSLPLSYGVTKISTAGRDCVSCADDLADLHTLTMEMKFLSRRIPAGARLRLAFSQSLWPMVTTLPRQQEVSLQLGNLSYMELPSLAQSSFEVCDHVHDLVCEQPEHGHERFVTENVVRGGLVEISRTVPVTTEFIRGADTNLSLGQSFKMRIDESNPCDTYYSAELFSKLDRNDWRIETTVRTEVHASGDSIVIAESIRAREGDEDILIRNRSKTIGRSLF